MASKKVPPGLIDGAIDVVLDVIPDTEPQTKAGKVLRVVKKVFTFLHKFIKISDVNKKL
jgi:hypothetical protein